MELRNHLISKEQARVLQKEFVETRGNVINKILEAEGRIKGQDCRDFWLPIDVLKEFILKVEKQAREEGRCEGLGIRIFSGAYPKDAKVKDAGYATVFLMPGYQKGSKIVEEELVKSKEITFAEKSEKSSDELVLNLTIGGHPPEDV